MTPFDYIKTISSKKEYLDPETKEYVPFIVNKALSFMRDTVFWANEMNRYPELTKTQQYDFYYNGVPKGNRWSKWSKKDMTENVRNVMEYYECSLKKADEILKILTPDQLVIIAAALDKGG